MDVSKYIQIFLNDKILINENGLSETVNEIKCTKKELCLFFGHL